MEISKFGFCKFINNSNNDTVNVPEDVSTGKGVQLKITYTWEGSTFKPTKLTFNPMQINTNGEIVTENISLKENGEYSHTNGNDENSKYLTLKIENVVLNGQRAVISKDLDRVTINQAYVYNFDNSDSDSDSDSEYKYECVGEYIVVKFLYKYSNGDIDYIVEIKAKIYKPNKYDNNVIFTKKGVEELLANIKEYPVINVEEVDADQWNTVSNGQPSIKITHGNKEYSYAKTSDTSIISGKKYFTYNDQDGYKSVTLPNEDDLDNYYELVNYKYVKVGSNIKFKDSSGDDLTATTSTTAQSTGTFRVSVNNNLFEVPINGFNTNTTAISVNKDIIQANINPDDRKLNLGQSTNSWGTLYVKEIQGEFPGGSPIIGKIPPVEEIYTSHIYGERTSSEIGGISVIAYKPIDINGTKFPSNDEDKQSKFLRGDGKWTHTLEKNGYNRYILKNTSINVNQNKFTENSFKLGSFDLYNGDSKLLTYMRTYIYRGEGTADPSDLESPIKYDTPKITLRLGVYSNNTIIDTKNEVTINNNNSFTLAENTTYYAYNKNASEASAGTMVNTTNLIRVRDSSDSSKIKYYYCFTTDDKGQIDDSDLDDNITNGLDFEWDIQNNESTTSNNESTATRLYYLNSNTDERAYTKIYASTRDVTYLTLANDSATPTTANGGYYSYQHRIATSEDTVFSATKVFNAVFNDYAEYRSTINLTPGHVVIDQDDGTLTCSTARLQPGAQIISDTFGHSMGETDTAKTPIAVAGRVLVYPYQPRENYHAGMAVCSAPDGTVDIMTREEIRDYPDCIVGIVSEIPEYETWGSDNVKVNGRIWIRVK